MSDLIDRQAAIDVTNAETVSTNPDHFEAHEKFIQFMDDAEISSFGKWQWANGFNTALIAIKIGLEKLPSAQPDVIRCKDCKHQVKEWRTDKRLKDNGYMVCGCDVVGDACGYWALLGQDDDYCSYAERRTDDEKTV